MFGNRAIYSDGWYARTIHRAHGVKTLYNIGQDKWELYNSNEDFSLSMMWHHKIAEKLKNSRPIYERRREISCAAY
jgi:arylsulfatase